MRKILLVITLMSLVGNLPAAQNGTSVSNPQLKDLGDTLRAQGNHQIFLSLLEKAGFLTLGLRANGGPYTVFAPSDAAFAKLPAGAIETIRKDPEKLRQFLLAHIIARKLMIADMLVPAKENPSKTALEVMNMSGAKVRILCDLHSGEHHPRINDVARIDKGDIPFSGGVIHEIDQLLHVNPFQ